jgi:hypothetical protein
MFYSTAFTQSKTGMENYNMISRSKEYLWMPIIHYHTKKGIYTELRYNYDADKAFSVNAGKTFSKQGELSFDVTPMIGLVMGSMKGYNLNLNQEAEYKKFFYSTQAQYTFVATNKNENFFYSWMEAGYNISKKLFAGVSCQLTKLKTVAMFADAGVMAGISFGNFSFPIYYFRPFSKNSFVIAGINYEWQLKTKRKELVTTEKQ